MKISTILDHIDSGHIALPEFQRGFVWNRDQVRGLFYSLYRRHPVGSLLVWATQSKSAHYRGDGPVAEGVVKLLLDGQQRMTSLYGVIRGKAPEFFDGNSKVFTGLHFNVENEIFSFYQPVLMRDDPCWIDVTELMHHGNDGLAQFITRFSQNPDYTPKIGNYIAQLAKLIGIQEVELHIEEVTGADKNIDVVVDIFNRVNSGGTKLSKGDLALAKICADWPEARDHMKNKLKVWNQAGYSFNLDWLLRSINTVLTGEAKFQFLHNKSADEIKQGLDRASRHIDNCLNLISGRLGLDHDRVFFGRFAVPVMVSYLDQCNGNLLRKDQDKLLFWFIQAGMWGRFSGSTESYIDQDLAAISGPEGNLDKLLDQIRLWHGGLRLEAGHFTGWSRGARFYPVLYLLTRMGEARDWGNGIPLKANMLGKMNSLELHHIFPKARLRKIGYRKPEVNALANFCFQTKQTNLDISDRFPEDYFPEVENNQPGSLSSQWIPMEKELWKPEKYLDFLEARKVLLAEEANRRLAELLHGETRWIKGPVHVVSPPQKVISGITSEAEEQELESLNKWVVERGIQSGQLSYDYANPETGEQEAVFDLVWPNGLQQELTEPVAVLLNETAETLALANQAGFRCFTNVEDFKIYIKSEILVEVGP